MNLVKDAFNIVVASYSFDASVRSATLHAAQQFVRKSAGQPFYDEARRTFYRVFGAKMQQLGCVPMRAGLASKEMTDFLFGAAVV